MRRLAVIAAALLVLAGGYGGARALSSSPETSSGQRQARAEAGDPARGKKVFLKAGCGACHTFAAAGTKATIGPNLDRALRGRSSAFVRQSIVSPNARIAKGYKANVMPKTYGKTLSQRQIADLVAFLITRRR